MLSFFLILRKTAARAFEERVMRPTRRSILPHDFAPLSLVAEHRISTYPVRPAPLPLKDCMKHSRNVLVQLLISLIRSTHAVFYLLSCCHLSNTTMSLKQAPAPSHRNLFDGAPSHVTEHAKPPFVVRSTPVLDSLDSDEPFGDFRDDLKRDGYAVVKALGMSFGLASFSAFADTSHQTQRRRQST